MKLTQAQKNAIHEIYLNHCWEQKTGGGSGWFYPNWKHETAAITCHPNTCKVLCGLGLLEYQTTDYRKIKGQWKPSNLYRITDAGIEAARTIKD